LQLQQAKNKETRWEVIPQEVVKFKAHYDGIKDMLPIAGGSPAVRASRIATAQYE